MLSEKTKKIKNVLELETISRDNAGLQEVEKKQPKGDLEGVCVCVCVSTESTEC